MNRRDFLKALAATTALVPVAGLILPKTQTLSAENVYANAHRAYAPRRLRIGYTGPIMRIRDEVGERDVFHEGEVTQGAAVVRMYDQSGNGQR